jgi:hypothetical protein
LLSFKDNEEVQCHAISTLRNLAASSEKNKTAIVKAGAVQSIKELLLEVPMNVQSEMTACVAVLALSGTSNTHAFAHLQLIQYRRRIEGPIIGNGHLRSPYTPHQLTQLRGAGQ